MSTVMHNPPPVAPPPVRSRAASPSRPQSTPRRRRLVVAMFIVYLLVLAELGARGYWWLARGAAPHRTDRLVAAYYPELMHSGAMSVAPGRDDATFDVLLLGASVLHPRWGRIEPLLHNELRRFTTKPVRVVNLAQPGHTTRDSLLKYRALDGRAFDLVIVYHGINDVRQNNVPRERFRSDYAHCGWYRKLALLDEHPESGWFALPCTLHAAAVGLGESPAFGRYLPRDTPPGGWGPDGLDVKTAAPFAENLRAIASLAEHRGDPLVLMTFAHRAERYLPFKHLVTGVNAWGTAEGVVAGMAAHNAAVRNVRVERPTVLFVDQAAGIPASDHWFTDPCHLTDEGCRLWIANLSRALALEGSVIPPPSPDKAGRCRRPSP